MTEPEYLPAFILHTRPYRETSQLVDLFVANAGKVTVVSRGSRTQKSAIKGLLQPFLPVNVRYAGKSSLKTLQKIEASSLQIALPGERLFTAMYLNELLYYLLESDTDYPGLFSSYFQALLSMSDVSVPVADTLRQFEFLLIQQLGYGVDFEYEADSMLPIQPNHYYRYQLETGFIPTELRDNTIFRGHEILGMATQQFTDDLIASAARKFCRQAFSALLGNKRLRSRELYSAYISRRSE